MDFGLTVAASRVLGSLVEKEITTPEYYPLSLNALSNACNQRSNRNPVMDLDEDAVRTALTELEDKGMVAAARGSDARVSKYEHQLQERFNLRRGEMALMCVLLLRGAQTPGELRSRSERMHSFAELEDVQATLQRLMERDLPLARALPREPGTKEVRYVELLSATGVKGTAASPQQDEAGVLARGRPDESALEAHLLKLEEEVRELRTRLNALEQKLEPLLA